MYICVTKTRELPFWFSTIKADLVLSENSQLVIFATKYDGALFDIFSLIYELSCTRCTLSIFVAIFSLDASVRTFDISSTRIFLVSDQEFLLAWWCLKFLKIRVYLKDLFCNSSISLSISLIVSFCQLIYTFWWWWWWWWCWWSWSWIVFVIWLTEERCLALFPAGAIVRDPHHGAHIWNFWNNWKYLKKFEIFEISNFQFHHCSY